jgi:hypothetical protein
MDDEAAVHRIHKPHLAQRVEQRVRLALPPAYNLNVFGVCVSPRAAALAPLTMPPQSEYEVRRVRSHPAL